MLIRIFLNVGKYICIAKNVAGTNRAQAILKVRGPPVFLIEPYNIEALPDTTIELPCQLERDDEDEENESNEQNESERDEVRIVLYFSEFNTFTMK